MFYEQLNVQLECGVLAKVHVYVLWLYELLSLAPIGATPKKSSISTRFQKLVPEI